MDHFNLKALKSLSSLAIDASKLGGDAILQFYKKDFPVQVKLDGSPLTRADTAANQVITEILYKSNLPVVSEEVKELAFTSNYYWLVDPLDGTKDFIDANDEFTINIALIFNEKPIIGVIFAPALNELYVGISGENAWADINGQIKTAKQLTKSPIVKMAISRFHNHPDTAVFANENKITDLKAIGSSLKYGRLILGEIDVYPRLVGTSEWDTAAGQAILEAAGGSLLDWYTGLPLNYNKLNRRNGKFIAFRAPYTINDFKIKLNRL